MVAGLDKVDRSPGAGESPGPQPGEGKLKAIGDAPGEYVRVKA